MISKVKTMPLVSIVIPTYNGSKYLAEAVRSVLDQTYDNIEVIVIDDGSNDSTKEVIDDLLQDLRVKSFHQPNQELSSARNHGLRVARGEYIQFLDDDDILYPDKLSRQVKELQRKPELFAVYCSTAYFATNPDSPHFIRTTPVKKDIVTQIFGGNFLPVLSVLMRKPSVLG